MITRMISDDSKIALDADKSRIGRIKNIYLGVSKGNREIYEYEFDGSKIKRPYELIGEISHIKVSERRAREILKEYMSSFHSNSLGIPFDEFGRGIFIESLIINGKHNDKPYRISFQRNTYPSDRAYYGWRTNPKASETKENNLIKGEDFYGSVLNIFDRVQEIDYADVRSVLCYTRNSPFGKVPYVDLIDVITFHHKIDDEGKLYVEKNYPKDLRKSCEKHKDIFDVMQGLGFSSKEVKKYLKEL